MTVHCGDCLAVMPTLEAESVDAIVTDPPYGLEFMGKAWDTFKPGFKQPQIGEGDGSPHRRNRGTPAYTAAGNPTCKNCGGDKYRKGERKCQCDRPDFGNPNGVQMLAFQEFMTEWAIESYRVAKPGAHLVAFGGTRTYHRLTCAIEDAGWEIRDSISLLREVAPVVEAIAAALTPELRAEFFALLDRISGDGVLCWLYGSGFPKSHNGPWGGTALKPGWEPIILARKPLAGTVEGNHAKHGTGALNIDGCRIGDDERTYKGMSDSGSGVGVLRDDNWKPRDISVTVAGRWPANVVLDEEAAALLDEQSGERPSGARAAGVRKGVGYGSTARGGDGGPAIEADTGGATRFFYTAKASRSERNAGLDGFAERKPHADEPNGRAWDIPGSHSTARANHHPTVKPLDLMQWLCRLVTPKGGLILDPFTGSGTTGRAAIAEGFRFIGIEKEPEYVAIARARIAEYAPLFGDPAA